MCIRDRIDGSFNPGTIFHSFNNSAVSGEKIIHAFTGILNSCPESVTTKPSSNYNLSTGVSYYMNGYGAHIDVAFDYQSFLEDIYYIWSEN